MNNSSGLKSLLAAILLIIDSLQGYRWRRQLNCLAGMNMDILRCQWPRLKWHTWKGKRYLVRSVGYATIGNCSVIQQHSERQSLSRWSCLLQALMIHRSSCLRCWSLFTFPGPILSPPHVTIFGSFRILQDVTVWQVQIFDWKSAVCNGISLGQHVSQYAVLLSLNTLCSILYVLVLLYTCRDCKKWDFFCL